MARQSRRPRASSMNLLDETNRPLTVITANADGFHQRRGRVYPTD
jgi:NAD-dependent SIR2 family protein deacetylase